MLKEYKSLLLLQGHNYNFVLEVRFTKANDFLESLAYRRDSIWLSMYYMDTDKTETGSRRNLKHGQ
ncbi:MAG: hypothetical protein IT249_13935 [Chitinophagaceae bacterium]|nr:hypothetical protein [Chitinophagaceae bacterium]